MQVPPKRIGRPPKPGRPGERISLGLKVTAQTKERLDREAKKNGRTQSQEAELRLERSFERNDLLADVLSLAYGRPLAGLLVALGEAMDRAGRLAALLAPCPREDWFDHPFAYDQALSAAHILLEAARPPGAVERPADPLPHVEKPPGQQSPGAATAKDLIRAIRDAARDDAEIHRIRELLGARTTRFSDPTLTRGLSDMLSPKRRPMPRRDPES
jgi:hypothetical protein